MINTTVVIIAGGKGTRIASVNSEIPKAMLPINGKPILEYQIVMAKRYGITDFLLIIGHLGDAIIDYFGDGEKWDVSIRYYMEETPMGTAGAMPKIAHLLTDDFFIFYGDIVMDVDLEAMYYFHKKKKSEITLLVHPNDHPYDSDIVELGDNDDVLNIYFKPHSSSFVSKNLVNASLFIFSPEIFKYIREDEKSNFEKDIFPICLNKGMKIYGYISHEYIKDMGTPDRYVRVCNDLLSGKIGQQNKKNRRKAFFLDRDGVINKEVNLLSKPEQIELIKGVGEAIRKINESEFLAIVITNQPVIARNMCSIEELNYIHATIETFLGKENAYLNAVYYCPHHPDKGYPEERIEYKINCDCRKPKPGMIFQAAKDWNIDLSKSYFIGDSDIDIEAGNNAGVYESIKIEQNQDYGLLSLINQIL